MRSAAGTLDRAGRAVTLLDGAVGRVITHLPATSGLVAPSTGWLVAQTTLGLTIGDDSLGSVGARLGALARGLRYAAWAYDNAETLARGGFCVIGPDGSVAGLGPDGAPLPLIPVEGVLSLLLADAQSGPRFVAASADPAAVRDQWLALTPAQRTELITADAHHIGNLAGIPTVDRDRANRIMLQRDRAAGEALFRAHGLTPPTTIAQVDALSTAQLKQLGYLDGPVPLRTPGVGAVPGWSPMVDERTRGIVARYRTALSTAATATPGSDGTPRLVQTYDSGMYGNEGRVAIAFGNPDLATYVALCVPGLASRGSKMHQVGGDARRLQAEAARGRPPRDVAVIAWQGYDAPDTADVASQRKARAGAQLLTRDVTALRAAHTGPVNLTVVGHSYGSTTVGLALQNAGLADQVDQVALIGSPGVGGTARSVDDLHLRRDRVFVGSASRDQVTTNFQSLGADPAKDSFGATRFKAESVERASDFAAPWNMDDHSRYYDSDHHSESLYALADIVSGRKDQLAAHDMLAQPRHSSDVLQLHGPSIDIDDPEHDRTPTEGHQH
ncbi:alpha/beta hydrolase [Luteipulveratus sp. YIM 133132]|uniref:alpha/beta hydrolase n=1 Tax=Luteipulveratus flavus TaxID=3031728 RepID=UPI0023B01896|nr:alpha/beta hydrolase [Luteipulveratus sp. YIM 133132]MDE9364662.1 alpha/beta hydrolase [Luteipulveratus sp. YIM 133132]